MKRYDKDHAISGVFVFMLLGVFAVFGTILVLLCSQAYRSTVLRTAERNENRVLRSFLRHAVRAEDEAGAVTVREMDGRTVLCIADDTSDDAYVTYLYVHDGWLCEQYADSAMPFRAERGEEICAASDLRVTLDGHRLTASITDAAGRTSDIVIVLYSGEGTP